MKFIIFRWLSILHLFWPYKTLNIITNRNIIIISIFLDRQNSFSETSFIDPQELKYQTPFIIDPVLTKATPCSFLQNFKNQNKKFENLDALISSLNRKIFKLVS